MKNFTAKDANHASEGVLHIPRRVKREIIVAIKKACELGRHYLVYEKYINERLNKAIKLWLEELGYKVTFSPAFIHIEWRKNNESNNTTQ